MALRMGVTLREEFIIRRGIVAGKEWPELAVELTDCDLAYVKEFIYEPLLDQHTSGTDIIAEAMKSYKPGDVPKAPEAADGPPPGDDPDPAKPPAGTAKL
jgi:hypothetical protein